MNDIYTKYAFISYNHKDIKIAKWLHKKLEAYKLPTEIHNEMEDSRYLRPIFRDQEDLSTGVLNDELRKNLLSSKYLIVICSTNSSKSQWVNREVECFLDEERVEYIIPFIVGVSNANAQFDSLPPSLKNYFVEHPDKELLGISINEVGKQKSFIRVVSKMLEVSFDELWKRHERERKRKILIWSIVLSIISFLMYWVAMPITLNIKLKDASHNLPLPEKAILNVNGAAYTLRKLDTTIQVGSIPGYYRWNKMQILFKATYYKNIKKNIVLQGGIRQMEEITLKRDDTFSVFTGVVMDDYGKYVERAKVTIAGKTTFTNKNGRFSVIFSVKNQTVTKNIEINKEGKKSILRSDESPSNNLKYVMHARNSL